MHNKAKIYEKVDGTRELKLIESPTRQAKQEQTNHENTAKIIAGYSKLEGTLEPTLFIIISGGIKREKDYFRVILSNIENFPRLRIHFVAEDQETNEEGLSPRKMYRVTNQIKSKYDKSKGEDVRDNIYLVVDVDDFIEEILEIKPLCENDNMHLIISNSCFEVWLYYGKFSEPPKDFQIPSKSTKISSAFKNYLGNNKNIKGGINPQKAIFDIETAINNAKINYKEDENGIPLLFSTSMFKLAENMLELLKEDLEKFKELQKNNRLRYLN